LSFGIFGDPDLGGSGAGHSSAKHKRNAPAVLEDWSSSRTEATNNFSSSISFVQEWGHFTGASFDGCLPPRAIQDLIRKMVDGGASGRDPKNEGC